MFKFLRVHRRARSKLLFLTCALLALALPAIAYAWTNFNYATGFFGSGGGYPTPGYAPREYNRVWHQAGYEWVIWYQLTGGGTAGYVDNTSNPTSWPHSISYAQSWCFNWNDESGVQWTCQTTKP